MVGDGGDALGVRLEHGLVEGKVRVVEAPDVGACLGGGVRLGDDD